MIETIVLIDTMEKIKKFNVACQHHIGDVTVCSGRNIADGKELYKYRIDGKSILGLYSLDLSTPVKVEIEGDIDEELKSVINLRRNAYDKKLVLCSWRKWKWQRYNCKLYV